MYSVQGRKGCVKLMEEDKSCVEGEYLVRCSARAEEVRGG